MAQDDGQERTERATPKRLKEAREKGQIPRSRELTTTALLVTGAGVLLILGDYMMVGLTDIVRAGLRIDRAHIFEPVAMTEVLGDAVWAGLAVAAPLFGATLVAILASSVAVGGLSFNAGGIAFKWSKIDPIEGFSRLVSWRSWVEMFKAVAKFGLVSALMVWLLWELAQRFLALGFEPLDRGLAHAGQLLGWSFFAMSAAMVLIAAVDVPFQIWDHARQLRMTRQEIRDEFKETDGRPEVKGRIRRMQQEIAQRRMMAEVPRADVVITNPTHYAVALRYEQDRAGAPRVVAKGADLIAAHIRDVAQANHVPLVSAPPLARAIYYSTPLEREIPAGLYIAVAKVLAYVFQLREGVRVNGRAPAPPASDDLPIPAALRRN